MRRLGQFLPLVLLTPSLAAIAQVPAKAVPASVASEVTFSILSDTEGTQLNSYFGMLTPELQKSFESRLGAAGREGDPHQQVDLLATIRPDGELSALRLAPGTQDSPSARAAWAAAKNTRFAPLPSSLGGSSLRLRMHFSAA